MYPDPNQNESAFTLPLFLCVILALIIVLITGCAHGPKPTRPEGMPYPTRLGPQIRAYPLNEVRCLGGGLGGCSSWLLGQ